MIIDDITNLGYRKVILDFHFSEYPKNVLSAVDAREICKRYKEAGATALLFYAKDHWGNCYYETDKFKRHCNVKNDLFGEIIEECKLQQLKFFAYYTVTWDEYYARLHPEWTSRDFDGNIKKANVKTSNWANLCINSPYREITYEQIYDIVSKYDFNCLFVDLVFYMYGTVSAPCYCKWCRKLWKDMYGEEMPYVGDIERKAKYLDFRDRFVSSYLKEFKETVKSTGKNVAITHNCGVDFSSDDFISKEAEPFGHDFYITSMTSKLYRAFGQGKHVDIYTARFNRFWDFTIKPVNQLIWEFSTILSNQASIVVIDQPMIDGSVDKNAISALQRSFSQVQKMEGFIADSKRVADIGILYSCRSHEMENDEFYSNFGKEFSGAYRILTELHLPFDVVVDSSIKSVNDIMNFKVIIVPYFKYLNPGLSDVLNEFIINGGTVIFDYEAFYFDQNAAGNDPQHVCMGLFEPGCKSPHAVNFALDNDDPNNRYIRINSECLLMRDSKSYEALGRLIEPAMDCDSYMWNSHNIQPGTAETGKWALTGRKGKGAWIYFSFRFFEEYIEQGLPIFREIFNRYLRKYYTPFIETNLHSNAEINVLRKGNSINLCIVNCTVPKTGAHFSGGISGIRSNYMVMDEFIPIHDIKIRIKGSYINARSIFHGSLKITSDGDGAYTHVEVPSVNIFDVISLEEAGLEEAGLEEAFL